MSYGYRDIADVIKIASSVTRVPVEDLKSNRRFREIAWARFIACKAAKDLTDSSYPYIGRHLGGRDHTTIMNACKRAEELIIEYDEAADDYNAICRIYKRLVGMKQTKSSTTIDRSALV
jgi:chromosomal replication initiator protein